MPQTSAVGSLGAMLPNMGTGLGAEGVGLAGLFGQLLQGGLAGGGDAAEGLDIAALNPEISTLMQGLKLQGAQTQTQLGDMALTIEGAETQAQAIQVLTQTVTVLYQHITTQGLNLNAGEGRTAELAKALAAMGVPAEEAQGMAKQIDTMLALLDKELENMKGESTPETMAGMAAVLMAGMMTQSTQQTTVTQTTSLTVQISMSETRSIMVRLPQTANTARDAVLGAAQANQTAAMVAVQAPAVPQVSVQVAEGEEASVQVALNTEVPTEALNTAAIPQPTVQKIEAPKDINGRLMYVLKETPTGAATVQAVTPTQDGEAPASTRSATTPALDMKPDFTEAAPTQQTAPQTDSQALQTAAPALQRFAEQMKQAQQNQVAQQVVVAVQPLLKNGEGGAVRMTINPPELGRIEIHLKIEAGQVSGAISANEPATVEHLARELPALKQAFADAGLKLGEQGLSLMLNQNPQDQQRQPNPFAEQPQNQNRNTPNFEGGAEDGLQTVGVTTANPARWVAPDRLLDRDI